MDAFAKKTPYKVYIMLSRPHSQTAQKEKSFPLPHSKIKAIVVAAGAATFSKKELLEKYPNTIIQEAYSAPVNFEGIAINEQPLVILSTK